MCLLSLSIHWRVLTKAVFGHSSGVGQQSAELLPSSLTLNLKGRTSLLYKVWHNMSLLRGPSGSGADSPTNDRVGLIPVSDSSVV